MVTLDAPVNREILGDAGRYARFGDGESLADRMIELLTRPGEGRETGRELRQSVESSFSWARAADRILDAYACALGRDSGLGAAGSGGPEPAAASAEDREAVRRSG